MTDTTQALEAANRIADMIEAEETASDAPAAAERPSAAESDAPATPRAMGFDVAEINREHALVLMGSKAVVVKEQPAGPIEDRVRVLSIEAFRAWYSNRPTEVVGSDGKIKATNWGAAWLTHKRRRQYAGIEFFPNPDGAEGTHDYLNLWRGYGVESARAGSYAIFRDHLFNNVCDGDPEIFAYVWAWFAHIFQRPRERIGTALVLRGRMGSGKTKVGEVIGSLIPAHYFMVDDPRYIVGQFNAHMASCLLLQAEEAVWAGDKHAEGRLKGLITAESQMIESKGIDPIRIKNYVRLMMTSNEDWVVPAGKDERRFCVLDVHPRCAQNHHYFREMDEELNAGGREALLRDLLDFDLSTVNLRQIPRTRALLEQKVRSFDSVESWWYNRLMDGSPVRSLDGWPSEIAISAVFDDYIKTSDTIGVGRKRDPATFGLKLAKLVPGIGRTRPRREGDDGAERRIWCYSLPPLDACRDAFEDAIGQSIDWPAFQAGESEAPAQEDDLDAVPV
ncbi:MAG: DUF5906 domain-containing protein [Pseudorhodoplanes sp.]|nr:DUF5906 domain-containing protein [Pseudorhodoplanes sp.]